GNDATVAEREHQITQVFALLTWRAIYPPEEGFTYTQSAHGPVASSSCQPAPDGNGSIPSPEEQALWSTEVQQAKNAPEQGVEGANEGWVGADNFDGTDFQNGSETYVDLYRRVYQLTLSGAEAPIANVPITGAKLFFDQVYYSPPGTP